MKNTFSYGMIMFCLLAQVGFAQEPPQVAILEARFSTTTPMVGETFHYFLKFDHRQGIGIYVVEHFAEQGLTVEEKKVADPQPFQGREIQQYTYTLRAQQDGEFRFMPVALTYAGPVQNPIAAQVDPVQLTVKPLVEARIVTNSPLMLNETLQLQVVITKRQPVTLMSLPQTLEAQFQTPPSAAPAEQAQANAATPTAIPTPRTLQFELDQSQTVTPQKVEDGSLVEQYQYHTLASPELAGEYVIPAATITYRTAAGQEVQTSLATTSILILYPNTSNLTIPTDYRFLILPAIVLAALTIVGSGGLLYLRHRRSRFSKRESSFPPLPPGELARKELGAIQAMRLPHKGEFKQYYSLVSEAVRKFLGAEFHVPVLERTTEEVMQNMHNRDVPEHVRERTGQFLQEADLVKFAKYHPRLEEAETAMGRAFQIVEESLEYHNPAPFALPQGE